MKVFIYWMVNPPDKRGGAEKTIFPMDVIEVLETIPNPDGFSQPELSDPQYVTQGFTFEVPDFQSCMYLVTELQLNLKHSHGIHSDVMIQRIPGTQFVPLEDFAADQERRANDLRELVKAAIQSLKATRVFFQDSKIHAIRKKLEDKSRGL
jgi:hypothetical protein